MEENTIVNEVAFGETSNGAAMVQGSFVGQGASMLFSTPPMTILTGAKPMQK